MLGLGNLCDTCAALSLTLASIVLRMADCRPSPSALCSFHPHPPSLHARTCNLLAPHALRRRLRIASLLYQAPLSRSPLHPHRAPPHLALEGAEPPALGPYARTRCASCGVPRPSSPSPCGRSLALRHTRLAFFEVPSAPGHELYLHSLLLRERAPCSGQSDPSQRQTPVSPLHGREQAVDIVVHVKNSRWRNGAVPLCCVGPPHYLVLSYDSANGIPHITVCYPL